MNSLIAKHENSLVSFQFMNENFNSNSSLREIKVVLMKSDVSFVDNLLFYKCKVLDSSHSKLYQFSPVDLSGVSRLSGDIDRLIIENDILFVFSFFFLWNTRTLEAMVVLRIWN